MRTLFRIYFLLYTFVSFESSIQAKIIAQVVSIKTTDRKSVVEMTLKNDFSEKVHAARMQVLLFDRQGKMVGQASKWVIGGGKDRVALAPASSTNYNFVIDTERPFATKKIGFSKIILERGKSVTPVGNFEVKEAK